MRIAVRVLCYLVLSIFVSPYIAQGQTTAIVTGSVTDPGGAAIVGAQVSVEQIPSAGQLERVVSGNDGRFSVNLAPGRYRVTISSDSFARIAQEITIAAGETRELPIRMALEPLSSKVVVTAEALPLDAESSPSPVTILTRQDIDQSAATSLPNLLSTQPGFSLGRTGAEGGTASLFLDGGNSNYTKVLVDGVTVNQPGGLVDFSSFTLENIDKIEIVHGAESALYGTDAMDGVIQIFTHRGTTRTPEFTAYADGGNFSTGHGGAELSGLLMDRFDYSAGVDDLETQGQGPNDAFRNRTLSGNFGWKFSDTARISVALRDNDSNAGTPGQTLLVPPNLTDSIYANNFSASLHAEFATGRYWRHQLTGGETYIRNLDYDPYFLSFYQYNRSSFLGESTYETKGFAFTAGYEYEVENGYFGLHARRNNQGGFLDARWQPAARLTLDAGVRAEDNTNFGTRVVPRVGAAYALRIAQGVFGDTRLHASYGQGIVEPRFDQSYSSDPCFTGNPTLLPEQSRTVHAGFDQKLASDRVHVSVDYFDSQFRDIISFGYLSTPPPGCPLSEFDSFGAGTYFNTDLARSRGGSLTTEGRLTHWLTATGNYTYDPTRVIAAPNATDPSEIPGNRLIRRPVNSGNLMLNAAYKRMNWNVSGYFTGRRTDSDFLGLGYTSNPGYARFDFAGSYNLNHGVSFYGRIANLANKQYQDAIGYPALGREYRIGVKYTRAVIDAPTMEKVLFCWSGGKDSAMALHALQSAREYGVTALLTTVTEEYDRISMHGVRRVLLERQAESIGLPLHTVLIPPQCINATYEARMKQALSEHLAQGVHRVAFGDIFLEDLRVYREKNLALLGMEGMFPIWKRDTRDLARDFVRQGFRAIAVCVDPRVLDPSFAGRELNESFFADLPPGVDPCGENGEFHTFVFDGPVFQTPIRFEVGEKVMREGFCFCDLLPG